MKIPTGVNHHLFYKQCKEKGIKIESKFTGVVLNKNGNSLSWMARYQGPAGFAFLGRYAFSEAGELEAKAAYEKHLASIGEDMRYTEKRKYKRKQ